MAWWFVLLIIIDFKYFVFKLNIFYTYLGFTESRDVCLLKLFLTPASLVNMVLVFNDLSFGENLLLYGYSSGKLISHVETSVEKWDAPT